MSLAHPALRAVLDQPLSAAERSGRPVVLFATNNVPLELIHAAGCFPLQLPTAPRAETPRADRYLERGFDPLVRVALELLLSGELACARAIVLPRSSDAWQRLYYYLCELRRSFAERVPEPLLYDLLHTPFQTSAQYNRASTRALADALSKFCATGALERELGASIALYNRIRDQLRRVAARRRAVPCGLRGSEALALYAAAQRIEPEALEPALEALLASSCDAAPGRRTLLIGSAHDTAALHEMIERAGGQVVADYHWRGDLLFGPNLREDAAPLDAICEHYHRQSLSTRTLPPPLDALLELVDDSRAEAAVFFYYEEEEAMTWDYPAQQAALRARGVASLLLGRESYPPRPELEARLRVFLSALAS